MPRLLLPCLLVTLATSALARDDGVELLDESEYRRPLEEVVIRADKPRWDNTPPAAPNVDPRDIEFTSAAQSGVEWLPKYTAEERDDYQGVRDRTNEKPLIKLFEFKF